MSEETTSCLLLYLSFNKFTDVSYFLLLILRPKIHNEASPFSKPFREVIFWTLEMESFSCTE